MADHDICYFLASWAKQFTRTIHEIISKAPRTFSPTIVGKIMDIITSLGVASTYIESLPRYWIEPDLEMICRDILLQITKICLWPKTLRYHQSFIVKDCTSALARLWANGDKTPIKRSILKYFTGNNIANVKILQDNCKALLRDLEPPSNSENDIPPGNLKRFAQYDHVEHCRSIIPILDKHCRCRPNIHAETSHEAIWHPTRLFLEAGSRCMNFDILVASMDMSTWQEFRFIMSSPSDTNTDVEDGPELAEGQLCNIIESRYCARVSFKIRPNYSLYRIPQTTVQEIVPAAGVGQCLADILRNYHLAPRDRIILSYAIAKAYWKFYDSDLMRRRWSSETIWFMPPENTYQANDLPVQAFVALPFGATDEPLADLVEDIRIPLNHRSPRVFALGVLLLEIGLAKPLQMVPWSRSAGHANFNHKTAINNLKELRNDRWDGFSHMNYFTNAVDYCLQAENFIQGSGSLSSAQPTHGHEEQKENIAKRRKQLHDRVVLPLAYLALQGFKQDTAQISHLRRKRASPSSSDKPKTVLQQPQLDGAFLSGQSTYSEGWLDGLKLISAHIQRIRAKTKNPIAIRVAILDTGLNQEMPFYKDEDEGKERLGRIVNWKDYVQPGNLSHKMDTFGHGSLMARLIMETCPMAEILVARVAENTKNLPKCEENILQAIKWARENRADIISMSFGLARDNDNISKEICTSDPKNTKRLIFLASAGNSPEEGETFPARLSNVISLYATKRSGSFLETNAQRPSNGTDILGTFGDGVPHEIQKEFDQEYRGICASGSSIACAVAAGIAANMLAYISVLPGLVEGHKDEDQLILDRANSGEGMAAIFRLMTVDRSDGCWFMTPSQFWRERNTHKARYHAIWHTLWSIHRRRPR